MQPREYGKMFEAEDRYFYFVVKHQLIRDLLELEISVHRNPVILDVGCGTGGLLKRLVGLGIAIGVDRDRRALEFCGRRGLNRLALMNWENSAIGAETCHAVVASDFIEHLEDDVAGLKGMFDVLIPSGKLIITVPALPSLWSPHDEALGHKRRYTKESLHTALSKAGFVQVKVFPFMSSLLPVLVPLRVAWRFLNKRRAKKGMPDTISYNLPGPLNSLFLSLLNSEREAILKGRPGKKGSTLVAVAEKGVR